jgi:chromosome segregation ATPase
MSTPSISSQIESLVAQSRLLEQEFSREKARAKGLEHQLSETKQSLEERATELRAQCDAAAEENQELKSQCHASGSRAEALEEERDKLSRDLEESLQDASRLRGEYSKCIEELRLAQERLGQIEQELHTTRTTNHAQTKKVAELSECVRGLRGVEERARQLQSRLGEAEGRAQSLEEEARALAHASCEQLKEIERISAERNESLEVIAELSSEAQSALSRASEAEKLRDALSQNLRSEIEQKNRIQAESERAQRIASEAESRCKLLAQERDTLRKEIEISHQNLAKTRSQIAETASELRMLRAQAERTAALDQENRTLLIRAIEAEARATSLNEAVNAERQQRARSEEQIANMQKQLIATIDMLGLAENRVGEATRQIEILRGAQAEMNSIQSDLGYDTPARHDKMADQEGF